MGLLDWLFGNSEVAGKPKRAGSVVRDGDWLRIPGIDFYGQYVVSANGQFTFGWCDSHTDVSSNGGTRNVSGRYVLVEGERVALMGQMQRPNDGRVANNGTFAVCDWMFTTALKGTFRVIDRSGTSLVAHLFKANLYRCGISDDGQWAVCQTANADNRDGNKLTFFEVLSGKQSSRLPSSRSLRNSASRSCSELLVSLSLRAMTRKPATHRSASPTHMFLVTAASR